MKLYIVRHGQSVHNAKDFHQPGDTPLSKEGIKQAEFLAKRFLHIPIGIIFSSDLERTKQTAEKISKVLQKEIHFDSNLREIKRSTEIVNKSSQDKKVLAIQDEIQKHIEDPNWHYSDEENFFDLKKRVENFIETLSQRKEEKVLLVSHGVTIRMIIGVLIFQEQLNPRFFTKMTQSFLTRNSGITLLEKEKDIWRLITWNDHAHL